MVSVRRILCPCDFSDYARRALHLSAALASWYRAELTAVHVIERFPVPGLPIAPPPFRVPAAPPSPIVSLQAVREQLESFVRSTLNGAAVTCALLEGDPSRQIVAHADHIEADLIVLGTHGRGAFERWVLGSVAEKVLRRARCPVLTVSRRRFAPPPGRAPFRRVLCPVDLSGSSLRALEHAVSLAGGAPTELVVLHVIELPPVGFGFTPAALDVAGIRKRAAEEIAGLVERAVPEELRSHCRIEVVAGETRAYREVLGLAGECGADLIAMGVTGRTAMDRMLFGSNATQVVRGAHCPVLTVRESLPAAADDRNGG